MKAKIAMAALAVLFAAGCAVGPGREHVGVGVGVGAGPVDYYDGYYDGFYGPFVDGYWGNDGFFWYSDANHGWHRDEYHHFGHAAGAGPGWNHIHGSGTHRDH